MNSSSNEKEPTLEEYNLEASSYEAYRDQKITLEKSLLEHEENLKNKIKLLKSRENAVVFYIAYFLGFLCSYFLFENSFLLSIVLCIPIGIGIGFILALFFAIFNINLYSDDILVYENKIKEIEKEKNNKIELIKKIILPFEESSVIYYENYLNNFYEENLYKKHSGNEKFEQSISIFYSMLQQVDEISNKLIFKNINTHSYKNYLSNRQIIHEQQKQNKQFFNSFNDISIKSVDVDIKNSLIIPREKKEIIPPERKYRTARKIDNWEEINKNKKLTGDMGEEIVLAIEKFYLHSVGRKDLADRVRHVSREDGDGLGYDILSFFNDEREKYIEVKSSTVSINSPFNISRNELGFLKENSENAFICRVLVSKDGGSYIPSYEMLSSSDVLNSEITPTSFIVKTNSNN